MNSCVTYINNGRIEGINNKVKVLNQVVYGNRNFFNYKIDLSQMRQNQNKKTRAEQIEQHTCVYRLKISGSQWVQRTILTRSNLIINIGFDRQKGMDQRYLIMNQ